MIRVTNILVVEDEQRMVKLLKHVLSSKDWRVFYVNDGVEALQFIDEYSPALIILDLMIPKIDGFEVCRRIHESSQIPVISYIEWPECDRRQGKVSESWG